MLDPRQALFRDGGEGFAILLRGAAPPDGLALAERLRAAVEHTPVQQGLPATISIEVSLWHAGEGSFDEALARTDHALCAA